MNFGDIRSVVNTFRDIEERRGVLAEVLAGYDGPWEPIGGYIPKESLPIIWVGGNGEGAEVLKHVDYYCEEPLSAVVRLAGRDEVIWHSDAPLKAVQSALLPIRREVVDKYLLPFANEYGSPDDLRAVDRFLSMLEAWAEGKATRSEVCHAKGGIYNIRLDIPMQTIRICAWQAADALTKLEPWDFAWHANKISLSPEGRELARINERVAQSLLKL